MPQSRKRRTAKRKHSGGTGPLNRPAHGGRHARRRTRLIAALLTLLLVAAGAAYLLSSRTGAEVTTASGLKYVDLTEGTGPSPRQGQTAVVHYTGTLTNGNKFDSSVDRGQPFNFVLGTGSVIKGWDEGVASMKVGGKRRLIVPPDLGYGPMGRPPSIPGNSTLIFEVELLDVK